MVEIDKTHLFNVAGEGFYLILSAFSLQNDKNLYEPALHLDSAVLKIGTLPGSAGDYFFRRFSETSFLKKEHHSSLFFNIYH